MNIRHLPCVEIETGPNPDAAVIWLHGLGADGHDFEPIIPDLGLPDNMAVRFVFPHAPSIPVSINGGYIMPAWYDIKHTDIGYKQDTAGIKKSAREIQLLIDREEMHGIKPSRIILAGFSQGGAMALYCGIRQSDALAGILGLSCYLLSPKSTEKELTQVTKSTPIMMAHGINDDVVPYALGDNSRRTLDELGYQVNWHTYPMPHAVCIEEIHLIGKWIARCFGYHS